MGCFNVQCNVSKMNIFNGDEMVVIPLFTRPNHSSSINIKLDFTEYLTKVRSDYLEQLKKYPINIVDNPHQTVSIKQEQRDDLYACAHFNLGVPFVAKYNDYGWFEIEEKNQPGVSEFISLIKNSAIDINKDVYQYCYDEFKPRDLKNIESSVYEDLESIRSVAQGNLLYVKSVSNLNPHYSLSPDGYHNVSFSFIDKKVFDHIVGENADLVNKIQNKLDKKLESLVDFLNMKTEHYKLFNEDPTNAHEKEILQNKKDEMRIKTNKMEDETMVRGLTKDISDSGNPFSMFHGYNLEFEDIAPLNKKTMLHEIDPKNKERIFNSLKSCVELFVVASVMSHDLSLKFSPVQYTGQTNSNKKIYEYHEKWLEIMNKKEEDHYDEKITKKTKKKMKP